LLCVLIIWTTKDIKVKMLIAHAEDDWDIPHVHTDVLFDSILSPYLPPLPPPMRFSILNPPGEKEYGDSQAAAALRLEKRSEMVRAREVEGFGNVEETMDGQVRVVKSKWGGHDPFGNQEGVQDTIREHFGLWP
jgi:abhydrolase domain-containing protein 12